jgi:EamA domain-containing membrane protein RarD
MIQRIQSVYLGIAIILLAISSIGVEFFSFIASESRFTFSSYGITEYAMEGDKVLSTQTFPIFVGTIALTLLCFVCLMSYKNLARQFKLGRMILGIYFLGVVSMLLLAYLGDSFIDAETTGRELGLGFILFVSGFPFIFLANTGIKRDKNLLESLDRLR